MSAKSLPVPETGRSGALGFVERYLSHLVCDDVSGSTVYSGGQVAADAALAAFEVLGYSRLRNEVQPVERRGASGLSPYIRHGLLQLGEVWEAVAGGPSKDVSKFRDELLWQDYARHWYAYHGTATRQGVTRDLEGIAATALDSSGDQMACLDMVRDELESSGWLVNQTRMWFSSHWAVRDGQRWQDGEDYFFTHLLDGSRAANRLGWQWTTGVGSSKPYGFSKWQVDKRAPGLCAACELAAACPIADWPDDPGYVSATPVPEPSDRTGPQVVEVTGRAERVWLTAESLGDADPALVANPDLPAVFVFDEALLHRLQLSSKRLVFLTETLADLAARRDLEIYLGDPPAVLGIEPVAVTWAPVPGFVAKFANVNATEVYPYPWLCQPTGKRVGSFSAWRKSAVRV